MRALALTFPLLLAAAGCNTATAETSTPANQQVVMGGALVAAAGDEAASGDAPAPTSAPTSAPTEEAGEHGENSAAANDRPGPLAPGETGHYGAEFTLSGQPRELSDALENCVGTGIPCWTKGTVDTVCQMSGCWFTVTAPDVDAVVRIRMQDYGFFVPRNAMGAEVVFQGLLELVEVPVEQAQHYADDEAAAGGEAREVTAPERTYAFTITGARITAPES